MIAYDYNPETFVYQGTIEIFPDPVTKGVYLYPAHSTNIKPPKPKENIAYCYNVVTKSWYEIPDYRGQTWYDKENNAVVIQDIGNISDDLASEKYKFISNINDLYNYIENKRYLEETDYLIIDNISFKNTRDTQNTWHHYAYKADKDNKFSIEWKNLNREFVTVNSKDIITISEYITKYVQYWFEIEKKTCLAINKGKLTSYEDIDTFINKYKGFKI